MKIALYICINKLQNQKMNLLHLFNCEPPEDAITIKTVEGKGTLVFIPILKVKEMLWNDFASWGTSNYREQYVLRGFETFISASLELNLEFHDQTISETNMFTKTNIHHFKFTGGVSFNTKDYSIEGNNNENFTGTAISECVKNASKNIGRKYGMFLYSNQMELPNTEEKKTKPSTKQAVNKIINSLRQ